MSVVNVLLAAEKLRSLKLMYVHGTT